MPLNRNKNRSGQVSQPRSKSGAAVAVKSMPLPMPADGVRQSQAASTSPFQSGTGIQIIPRRNVVNPNLLASGWALNQFAINNPLRLLSLLSDIDPDVGLALDNLITLTCNPGDVQFVAVPPGKGDHQPDDAGTAAINALLDSLPPEIGGRYGLQAQLTVTTACAGFVALDAVTGTPGEGLRRLWPVEPFSIMLLREGPDADLTAAQRQMNANIPPEQTPFGLPGYRRMNPLTFFWGAWQPFPEDPYGRAMFAPALGEVLTYLAMIQDLRDAVKHAAWPRLQFGFNFTETMKIAKEVFLIHDPQQASEWVWNQFSQFSAKVATLKSDDAVIGDTNGTAGMIPGGNFSGLEPILTELRSRIIRATKQLPVMMGLNDGGSTEGHTGVQWQVYAKRLEALRAFTLSPILKALNLHLRLLGLPLVAQAQYEKIRTIDALIEAQTAETVQRVAAKNVLLGWISNEEAARNITGSEPYATPEGDKAALTLVAGGSAAKPNPQQSGGTQEDTNAQKQTNNTNK